MQNFTRHQLVVLTECYFYITDGLLHKLRYVFFLPSVKLTTHWLDSGYCVKLNYYWIDAVLTQIGSLLIFSVYYNLLKFGT